jgi:hypothetical protein
LALEESYCAIDLDLERARNVLRDLFRLTAVAPRAAGLCGPDDGVADDTLARRRGTGFGSGSGEVQPIERIIEAA